MAVVIHLSLYPWSMRHQFGMLLNNVISYKSATPQKAPQRFTAGLKKNII